MVAMSVGQIIAEGMRGYCFGIAGENVTLKVRQLAFSSILRQEIGWFDLPENAPGTLSANLATDAALAQALSGETLGRNIAFVHTAVVDNSIL